MSSNSDEDAWSYITEALMWWGVIMSALFAVSFLWIRLIHFIKRYIRSEEESLGLTNRVFPDLARRDSFFASSISARRISTARRLTSAAFLQEADHRTLNLERLKFAMSLVEKIMRPSMPYIVHLLMNAMQIVLSILVCIATVANLSSKSISLWWASLRTAFVVFFIIDFFARAKVFEGSFFGYLSTPTTLVDTLSLVSVFVSFNHWISMSFLRAIMALAALESSKSFWLYRFRMSYITGEKLILLGQAITIIYVFSCTIFILETIGNPPGTEYASDQFSFFTSIYFTFITVTTVGYGDVYAKTFLGRLSVICFVIVGIVVFTDHITKLAQFIRQNAEGKGYFNRSYDEEFVIVCGNLNFDMVYDVAR